MYTQVARGTGAAEGDANATEFDTTEHCPRRQDFGDGCAAQTEDIGEILLPNIDMDS